MSEARSVRQPSLVLTATVVLLLTAGSSASAQYVIKVTGPVRDTLFPFGEVPSDLIVQVQYQNGDREADYEWSRKGAKYEVEIHKDYADTPMVFLVLHSEWTQTQPDTLIPENAGLYEHTLWVIEERNLAEIYFKQSLTAEALESLNLCLRASNLAPRIRYFLGAANALGRLLAANQPLPVEDLRLMRQWRHDPAIAGLSDSLRFDVAWELATALSRGDMAAEVEPGVTLFDLTQEAYEWAKRNRPADARPYQGLYRLHADAGLYADAARSLSEFFRQNSRVRNEKTITTFVSDWAQALEQRTDIEDSTDLAAVNSLAPQLRDDWRDLVEVMQRFRHVWSSPVADSRFERIWERAKNFASGS